LADAENTAAERNGRTAPASQSAPGGIDDARLDVRDAGYCVYCDRIVERADDGTCAEGHPLEAVTGHILLVDDDPLPSLPVFNWAAFLIPFVWGPLHGQWVGIVFLPIWLFVDSIISSARSGGAVSLVGAVVAVAGTLAFEWFFAKRANGLAFRRVMKTQTAEEFRRRQRTWAIAAVPVAALLFAWAVWFHVGVAPTLAARS